jgi:hypothetical protein
MGEVTILKSKARTGDRMDDREFRRIMILVLQSCIADADTKLGEIEPEGEVNLHEAEMLWRWKARSIESLETTLRNSPAKVRMAAHGATDSFFA